MAAMFTFHSANDFLGLRRSRKGGAEIVYDDGASRRMIWRVLDDNPDDSALCDALRMAVTERRVLPALYTELKRRAIHIEAVGV